MELSPGPRWPAAPHPAAGKVFVPSPPLLVLPPLSSAFPVPGFAAPSRQRPRNPITVKVLYSPYVCKEYIPSNLLFALLQWRRESADLLACLLLFSLSLHLLHFDRVHLPPPHEQIVVSDAQLQDLETNRHCLHFSNFCLTDH